MSYTGRVDELSGYPLGSEGRPIAPLSDYELTSIACPIDGGPRPAWNYVGPTQQRGTPEPPGAIAGLAPGSLLPVQSLYSRRQQIRAHLLRLGGEQQLFPTGIDYSAAGPAVTRIYVTKRAANLIGRHLARQDEWPLDGVAMPDPQGEPTNPAFEAAGAHWVVQDFLLGAEGWLATAEVSSGDEARGETGTRRAQLFEPTPGEADDEPPGSPRYVAIPGDPKGRRAWTGTYDRTATTVASVRPSDAYARPSIWAEDGWEEAPSDTLKHEVCLVHAPRDGVQMDALSTLAIAR